MNHNNQDDEVVLELEQPLHSSNTPPPTASFGNILQKFPEFLLHILPYIPDRIIWNSIASSNKKIYGKTKDDEAFQPPWPINFKLCVPGYSHDIVAFSQASTSTSTSTSAAKTTLFSILTKVTNDIIRKMVKHDITENERTNGRGYKSNELCSPVWSPDGTQIACFLVALNGSQRIVIFDQRRGLLHFHRYGDDDNDENNEIGWRAHEQGGNFRRYLRFSPDGSFLVSAGKEGLIKIWNYNSTDGYYHQLQEWNNRQRQEDMHRPGPILSYIDVSPCSKYVAVLTNRHVLLTDVQNNGKTIKSVLLPEFEWGKQIMFSSIDGHHSIFIRSQNVHNYHIIINIWRPFDDLLLTILEHPNTKWVDNDFALSRDNSMIAICAEEGKDGEDRKGRVMLYYLDNSATDSKSSLKQSFSGHLFPSIRFTPDGKYLSYLNENRLLGFFSLITGSEITDQMHLSYSEKDVKMSLTRVTWFDFPPVGCGQRFLVQEIAGTHRVCFYIASFWQSGLVQNNRKQLK